MTLIRSRLRRALWCLLALCASTPGAPLAAAADAAYAPSRAEKVRIEQLSTGYFDALERADYAAAYALLTPQMQAQISAADWNAMQQANRAQSGALRERVQRAVTWYLDPPEAPAPGLYVAVDYDSVYDADTHQSEYLIWFRPRGGSEFRLTRHEATVMKNVGHGAR